MTENIGEDKTVGFVTWHSSDEDAGPDVGVSVYLGPDDRLYCGEISRNLFEEHRGDEFYDGDGGWFLVRYNPDATIIAKIGEPDNGKEFIEQVGIWLRAVTSPPPPAVSNALVEAVRWYVGIMNDGAFIIDKPPRKVPTDYHHDIPGVNVIAVLGTNYKAAEEICIAHNAAIAANSASRDTAGLVKAAKPFIEVANSFDDSCPDDVLLSSHTFLTGIRVGDLRRLKTAFAGKS